MTIEGIGVRFLEDKAYQAPRDAPFALAEERVLACEVKIGVELQRKGQASLERSIARTDSMAPHAKSFLDPKRLQGKISTAPRPLWLGFFYNLVE
jgi:hypothetical protein